MLWLTLCNKWGFNLEQSMPLAYALKEKLGLNEVKAYEAMIASVDGQEIKLTMMN